MRCRRPQSGFLIGDKLGMTSATNGYRAPRLLPRITTGGAWSLDVATVLPNINPLFLTCNQSILRFSSRRGGGAVNPWR